MLTHSANPWILAVLCASMLSACLASTPTTPPATQRALITSPTPTPTQTSPVPADTAPTDATRLAATSMPPNVQGRGWSANASHAGAVQPVGDADVFSLEIASGEAQCRLAITTPESAVAMLAAIPEGRIAESDFDEVTYESPNGVPIIRGTLSAHRPSGGSEMFPTIAVALFADPVHPMLCIAPAASSAALWRATDPLFRSVRFAEARLQPLYWEFRVASLHGFTTPTSGYPRRPRVELSGFEWTEWRPGTTPSTREVVTRSFTLERWTKLDRAEDVWITETVDSRDKVVGLRMIHATGSKRDGVVTLTRSGAGSYELGIDAGPNHRSTARFTQKGDIDFSDAAAPRIAALQADGRAYDFALVHFFPRFAVPRAFPIRYIHQKTQAVNEMTIDLGRVTIAVIVGPDGRAERTEQSHDNRTLVLERSARMGGLLRSKRDK